MYHGITVEPQVIMMDTPLLANQALTYELSNNSEYSGPSMSLLDPCHNRSDTLMTIGILRLEKKFLKVDVVLGT